MGDKIKKIQKDQALIYNFNNFRGQTVNIKKIQRPNYNFKKFNGPKCKFRKLMRQNFNAGINIQLERKSWED